MSPRRAFARKRSSDQLDSTASTSPVERMEAGPEGTWVVRSITGSSSIKVYRCPGCDQEIRPATPHVVAWPEDDLEQRRHWHSACWRARSQRRVRPQRSGRGPRY